MLLQNQDAAPLARARGNMKKLDITTHILVPKFSKLSDEEKSQLLTLYNVSVIQLPTIFSGDPIVKAVNAKSGDVVKFNRVSNAGKTEYFRRVV